MENETYYKTKSGNTYIVRRMPSESHEPQATRLLPEKLENALFSLELLCEGKCMGRLENLSESEVRCFLRDLDLVNLEK